MDDFIKEYKGFACFPTEKLLTCRGGSGEGGGTQGINLPGGGMQSTPPSMRNARTRRPGACPTHEKFEKWMLKYCNLEAFPYKMLIIISCIDTLCTALMLMERFQ